MIESFLCKGKTYIDDEFFLWTFSSAHECFRNICRIYSTNGDSARDTVHGYLDDAAQPSTNTLVMRKELLHKRKTEFYTQKLTPDISLSAQYEICVYSSFLFCENYSINIFVHRIIQFLFARGTFLWFAHTEIELYQKVKSMWKLLPLRLCFAEIKSTQICLVAFCTKLHSC